MFQKVKILFCCLSSLLCFSSFSSKSSLPMSTTTPRCSRLTFTQPLSRRLSPWAPQDRSCSSRRKTWTRPHSSSTLFCLAILEVLFMIVLHLSFKHTMVFSMESSFLNESLDSSSNDVILCSTPYAVFFSFLLIQMLFMYFLNFECQTCDIYHCYSNRYSKQKLQCLVYLSKMFITMLGFTWR